MDRVVKVGIHEETMTEINHSKNFAHHDPENSREL